MLQSTSAKKYYRKRVKGSNCYKKSAKLCRKIKSCKNTRIGKRKSYCRKKTNTKRKK